MNPYSLHDLHHHIFEQVRILRIYNLILNALMYMGIGFGIAIALAKIVTDQRTMDIISSIVFLAVLGILSVAVLRLEKKEK
jgi:hypothetical protein